MYKYFRFSLRWKKSGEQTETFSMTSMGLKKKEENNQCGKKAYADKSFHILSNFQRKCEECFRTIVSIYTKDIQTTLPGRG